MQGEVESMQKEETPTMHVPHMYQESVQTPGQVWAASSLQFGISDTSHIRDIVSYALKTTCSDVTNDQLGISEETAL